jgi:hypothetical protein
MTEDDDLAQAAVAEVERLHEFFAAWFRGEIAAGADADALAPALAADFTFVPPSGREIGRAEVIAKIGGAHGCFADSEPPFRIWIEHARARPLGCGFCLVLYEEWQARPDKSTARVSSALLAYQPTAPGGVIWHHVQETWLAGHAGPMTASMGER